MFSDDNIWPLKLWLFLAALNGNHCGISSAGLISCSLTQPLSLSHFVCPCLIKQLPMRPPLSLLKSYVTLNLASHHPKSWDSLVAAKAFLNLSTMASFFACVCVSGRGSWMPGDVASKHHVAAFISWTRANPHVQIQNTNYYLLGCVVKYTHMHTNPGMSVFRRWIHLWVALRPLMANFCPQTGCYLLLNWDSLHGICRQRPSSVGLSWNSFFNKKPLLPFILVIHWQVLCSIWKRKSFTSQNLAMLTSFQANVTYRHAFLCWKLDFYQVAVRWLIGSR